MALKIILCCGQNINRFTYLFLVINHKQVKETGNDFTGGVIKRPEQIRRIQIQAQAMQTELMESGDEQKPTVANNLKKEMHN